jgi:protein-S-isoprenylcysteine O-methyltransferase Ste14
MLRVFARLLADTALVAIALFGSAGTFSWPRAWVLLAVLLMVRSVSAVAVYQGSPTLVRERARLPLHKDQPTSDRVLVLAVLGTGFIGVAIVAGLDGFHWHALPAPSRFVAALGLFLFSLGWSVKGLVLRANAFATNVVRLQSEREHTVVESGPYSVVRHPFYVGTLLVLTGQALWLRSYMAAIYCVLPIALIIARLIMEERLLSKSLPGYDGYAARVRHRLIPGIW